MALENEQVQYVFSLRLVSILTAKSMKPAELAKLVNLTPQSISQLCLAKTFPTNKTLTAICSALSVPPWAFFIPDDHFDSNGEIKEEFVLAEAYKLLVNKKYTTDDDFLEAVLLGTKFGTAKLQDKIDTLQTTVDKLVAKISGYGE